MLFNFFLGVCGLFKDGLILVLSLWSASLCGRGTLYVVWEGYIVCGRGALFGRGTLYGGVACTHWQNSIVYFNLQICVFVIADQKQVFGRLTLTLKTKFFSL